MSRTGKDEEVATVLYLFSFLKLYLGLHSCLLSLRLPKTHKLQGYLHASYLKEYCSGDTNTGFKRNVCTLEAHGEKVK